MDCLGGCLGASHAGTQLSKICIEMGFGLNVRNELQWLCHSVLDITAQSDLVALKRVAIHHVQRLLGVTVSFSEVDNWSGSGQKIVLPVSQGAYNYGYLVVEQSVLSSGPLVLHTFVAAVANQIGNIRRSTIDELTGLMNRRTLDEKLHHVFDLPQHSERRSGVTKRTLFVLDIDRFKSINDTYGHLFGDEVLVLFGRLLLKVFRAEDWLFRFGGDEFVIIANGLDVSEAKGIAQRLLHTVKETRFPQIGHLTVSVGYTEMRPALGRTEVFERADYALYHVKAQGRDGAMAYETLEASGRGRHEARSGDIELF